MGELLWSSHASDVKGEHAERNAKPGAFLSRCSVLHGAQRTGLCSTYGRSDGLELSLIQVTLSLINLLLVLFG